MSEHWPQQRKGEENPHARFSQEQVRQMRERHEMGRVTIRQLAEETGAGHSTIHRLLRRERYKDREG